MLIPNRLGLALGGGGARGLCHIGVLEVLEELGISADAISGTSMGGLIGALVAAGYDSTQLREIASSVSWTKLINWRSFGRLVSSKGFESWLRDLLPPTFEELELPLVLTATDVVKGRLRYLSEGDLITAVRATTAYPGVTEPVPLREELLVDGGILNQIPVDGALFLGARRVIAVNATALEPLEAHGDERTAGRRLQILGPLKEAFRAIDVMEAQLTAARLSLYRPDVLIDAHMDNVQISDFHRSAIAIQAGVDGARRHEQALRELADTPERTADEGSAGDKDGAGEKDSAGDKDSAATDSRKVI